MALENVGRTLVQVMACCLMAPSHYLNQCWLIITKEQWHSSDGSFTRDAPAINHSNYFENHLYKILLKSVRGQWVKGPYSWVITLTDIMSQNKLGVVMNNTKNLMPPIVTQTHYSDMTWVLGRLKSLATQLFVQQLVKTNNKKTS